MTEAKAKNSPNVSAKIDELLPAARLYYQEMRCEFYGHVRAKRVWSSKDEQTVRNFLTRMGNLLFSVNEQYLFEYTAYQFAVCSNLRYLTEDGKRIQPSFIFGLKAWQRWKSRGNDWYWMVLKFLENPINPFLRRHKSPDWKTLLQVTPAEEQARAKFLNEPHALAYCLVNTTLHHPKSPACNQCLFSERCKKIQRLNYPTTYRLRYG